MPPISKPHRINVNADKLEPLLRIVGYDPGQPISLQVQECVRLYAGLIAKAGVEIETMFSANEWCLIAEAMNGCLNLQLHSESTVGASLLLNSEVEDAIRLNRLDAKWFADEPMGPSEATAKLLGTLGDLTELQCQAVFAAVRYLWQTEDHPDDWWRVAHRMPARGSK